MKSGRNPLGWLRFSCKRDSLMTNTFFALQPPPTHTVRVYSYNRPSIIGWTVKCTMKGIRTNKKDQRIVKWSTPLWTSHQAECKNESHRDVSDNKQDQAEWSNLTMKGSRNTFRSTLTHLPFIKTTSPPLRYFASRHSLHQVYWERSQVQSSGLFVSPLVKEDPAGKAFQDLDAAPGHDTTLPPISVTTISELRK